MKCRELQELRHQEVVQIEAAGVASFVVGSRGQVQHRFPQRWLETVSVLTGNKHLLLVAMHLLLVAMRLLLIAHPLHTILMILTLPNT